MLKKIISVLLISILLTSSLVSCGGSGDGSDTTGAGTDTSDDSQTDTDTIKETDTHDTDGTTPPESSDTDRTPDDDVTSPSDTGDHETADPSDDVMSDPEVATLNYVALGDSICYGYGLASPETERYSAIIDSYIDQLRYYECESVNYGVNGQTSSELLAAIKADLCPALSDADVVSISIGANNVLSPATSMLMQYALNLLIEDADQRDAANAAAYAEFESSAAAGIKQFAADLPKIIAAINERAPEAQIIFQTIYNPYNNVSISVDFADVKLDLNEAADSLVSQLNDIIKANARSLEYDVADIYTAFETETGVVNADSGSGASLLTGLDPHPTAKGHRIIADTICALIYTV